jgi:hypothetical protein
MSDDEVTHAADSTWLAELRAAVSAASSNNAIDDAPLRGDEVPRFAEDLALETDVTLAGADVMEQVRQAVAATRSFEPPSIDQAPIEAPFEQAPTAGRPAERWSPPPRLKPASTPQLPPLLLPDAPSRPRRRVVILAAVALVAVGALIGGLLLGGGGGAPSRDTVPATSEVGGTRP